MPPLFQRQEAASEPKVAYRASMLPIGNYEDGSIAFPVWPQVAVDAGEALGRLGRGENPQPQDAVLANLAMTGGIAMPRPAGSIGMAGRPRPMPEPGMLAASNLERMRAEDAVKPRPFPDAPQNLSELESYLQKNVDGNSRTRADEAWAGDPTRYNAYSHGMADVLNPESQWWKGEPTLQSGGLVPFPVAAPGLMQQPVQPDGPGLMAQQHAPDYLNQRGYQQQPPAVQKFEQDQDLGKAYMDALFARQKQYEMQGMSPSEALAKAQRDDDLNALWRKSMGMP